MAQYDRAKFAQEYHSGSTTPTKKATTAERQHPPSLKLWRTSSGGQERLSLWLLQ